MFRLVASSTEFVEKWESEVISTCTSASTGDQLSRKRTASSSPEVNSSGDLFCGPSQSKKRCSYVGEGIDENIEKCRKGIDILL